MTTQKPRFSIVIPTLNEEKYIPRLLEDLADQTEQNFEVLVVDAHSEDDTKKLAKQFADAFPLEVINSTQRNVSHQRNLGAKHARADWVIFMDADDELPTYFMQGIAYQLEKKPETDVFTCWLDIKDDENKSVKHTINFFIEFGSLLPFPGAIGGLIGCRKAIFKLHTFDETQRYLEDSRFVKEVVQGGYNFRIFREPKWYFSMRRSKKEGTAKFLVASSTYLVKYLLGETFSTPESAKHYPMLGGSYYDEEATKKNPDFLFLKNIQQFMASASTKQLEQAKKLLRKIKDYEF